MTQLLFTIALFGLLVMALGLSWTLTLGYWAGVAVVTNLK